MAADPPRFAVEVNLFQASQADACIRFSPGSAAVFAHQHKRCQGRAGGVEITRQYDSRAVGMDGCEKIGPPELSFAPDPEHGLEAFGHEQGSARAIEVPHRRRARFQRGGKARKAGHPAVRGLVPHGLTYYSVRRC